MNPSRAALQFINVTDPKEIKDAGIQTLVKTHVMKAFRREERINTEKEAVASARQSPSQPSLDDLESQPTIVRYGYSKVPDDLHCLSTQGSKLKTSVSGPSQSSTTHHAHCIFSPRSLDSDDKVNICGGQECPYATELIQYFSTVFLLGPSASAPKPGLDPNQNIWMIAVHSTSCVFLAATFLASLHSGVLMNEAVSRRTYRLKSQALEQLASALSKVDQCKSQLVPAVLLLMSAELIFDDLKAYKTHLLGLQQMLEAIGGLNSSFIPWQHVNVTSILDLMGVLIFSTVPVYPHHEVPATNTSTEHSPSYPLVFQDVLEAGTVYDTLRRSLFINQSVLDLMTTLIEWTRTLMILQRDDTEIAESPFSAQARLRIQEAFNHVRKTQIREETGPSALVSLAVERTCQTAASIWWTLIKPSIPGVEQDQVRFQELEQLRLALQETETLDWQGGTEVLLWILLVAFIASKHSPGRLWFVARLVPLSISLGMSHFLSAANIIRDFI